MAGFLIVDDHPLVREALSAAVSRAFPDAPVSQAYDIESAEQKLAELASLDLVLFDLNVPGADGFSGLLRLRSEYPRIPILVITGHDDPRYQLEARAAGAAGFVSKADDPEKMLTAIETVMRGDSYWPDIASDSTANSGGISASLATLTPQQVRVLELLGQGLLNKQIAHELDIVESTVKAHVSAILRKLNVYSRTQAVLLAQGINFSKL
jgi:DNA-binding NarL/FixJ family response regulator